MVKCRELLLKRLLQDIFRKQMWVLSEKKVCYFLILPLDKSHFITDFIGAANDDAAITVTSGVNDANVAKLQELGVNKKADDLSELYIFDGVNAEDYFLVNTSGKVIDTNSKNKDGNDYVYVVKKNGAKPGKIVAIYVED